MLAAVLMAPFLTQSGTFIVINNADSGIGSLRAAISSANANADLDTIRFAIPLAPFVIDLASPLPAIVAPVVIDGTTQPGYAGAPLIVLNGAGAGTNANGLTIQSGFSTVRGLVINRFTGDGIYMANLGGNTIAGNYIGLNAAGSLTFSNRLNGIRIFQTGNNVIGGNTPATRNVISGNRQSGIRIDGNTASGNQVLGNYIGTDATGLKPLGNGGRAPNNSSSGSGITIVDGPGNEIGGGTPETRNIIAGNPAFGIAITGASARGNLIRGNYIGTDVTGTNAFLFINETLPFADVGIGLVDAPENFIGGTFPGEGNIICGHANMALYIKGATSSNNVVQGNSIGIAANGTKRLPNLDGIQLVGARYNLIGGTTPEARNIISGNDWSGIYFVDSARFNQIFGNYIGVLADGLSAMGNRNHNVLAEGGDHNQIGGINPGEGNIIAYDPVAPFYDGVRIKSGFAYSIRGNSIFGNADSGIDLGNPGLPAGSDRPITNDHLDADSGPNFWQNYPVIDSAALGTSLILQGTLHSTPNVAHYIDFYANSECDPGGRGEGKVFLGWTIVTNNALGNASFSVEIPGSANRGSFITSVATDMDGNSSEFSLCKALAGTINSDFSLSASSTNTVPVQGAYSIQYTLTNLGPDSSSAGLEVTLPANFEVTATEMNKGNNSALGSVLVAQFGGLAVNEKGEIKVTGKFSAPGSYTFAAKTVTLVTDPVSTNNTNSTKVTVTALVEHEISFNRTPNALELDWSNTLALEGTTSLVPPIQWQEITQGITSTNGTNSISISTTLGMEFFRLRQK